MLAYVTSSKTPKLQAIATIKMIPWATYWFVKAVFEPEFLFIKECHIELLSYRQVLFLPGLCNCFIILILLVMRSHRVSTKSTFSHSFEPPVAKSRVLCQIIGQTLRLCSNLTTSITWVFTKVSYMFNDSFSPIQFKKAFIFLKTLLLFFNGRWYYPVCASDHNYEL